MPIKTFSTLLVWRTDAPPDHRVLAASLDCTWWAIHEAGVWRDEHGHDRTAEIVCWADPVQPYEFVRLLSPLPNN